MLSTLWSDGGRSEVEKSFIRSPSSVSSITLSLGGVWFKITSEKNCKHIHAPLIMRPGSILGINNDIVVVVWGVPEKMSRYVRYRDPVPTIEAPFSSSGLIALCTLVTSTMLSVCIYTSAPPTHNTEPQSK